MSSLPHRISANGTMLSVTVDTVHSAITFKIDMRHYPHVAEAWAAFTTCDVTRNDAIHEGYRHLMHTVIECLPDLVKEPL